MRVGSAWVLGTGAAVLQMQDKVAGASRNSTAHMGCCWAAAGDFGERAAAFAKINCMAFSRDGRLLALGGEDGAVSLLDFPSLALRQRWEASKSEVGDCVAGRGELERGVRSTNSLWLERNSPPGCAGAG